MKKKILLIVLLILLFASLTSSSLWEYGPDGDKSLVGLWHMDGDAKDGRGYDNDGTVSGATVTNKGRFQKAYSFDGVDDSINLGTLNSINFSNGITIMAWTKTNKQNIYGTSFHAENNYSATTGIENGSYWLGRQGIDTAGGMLFDHVIPNTDYGSQVIAAYGYQSSAGAVAGTFIITDNVTGDVLGSGNFHGRLANSTDKRLNSPFIFGGTGHPYRVQLFFSDTRDMYIDRVSTTTLGYDGIVGKISVINLFYSSSNFRVALYGIGANSNTYFGTPTPSVYQFVAVTYDNENYRMYIDGKLIKTTAFVDTLRTSAHNFYVGYSQSHGTKARFWGDIDEVKIYNRSLTIDEIRESYNETLNSHSFKSFSNSSFKVYGSADRGLADETGLVGGWHFNGDLLDDSDGNDGTLLSSSVSLDEAITYTTDNKGGGRALNFPGTVVSLDKLSGDDDLPFGQSTNYQKIAQSFVAPSTGLVRSVGARRGADGGDPTGTVRFDIANDDGGEPGTARTTESYTQTTFNIFKTDAERYHHMYTTLTPGTTYWLIYRMNATDDTNYRTIKYDSGGSYGALKEFDGANWNAISGTLRFSLRYNDDMVFDDVVALKYNNFTVSWWMKRTTKGYQCIFTRGRDYGSSAIQARADGRIRFESYTNNVFEKIMTTGVDDLNWHYYTLVSSADNFQLYVDGANTYSYGSANTDTADQQYIYIGAQQAQMPYTYGVALNAKLDEVRMYNRSLSADDVRESYNETMTSHSERVYGSADAIYG